MSLSLRCERKKFAGLGDGIDKSGKKTESVNSKTSLNSLSSNLPLTFHVSGTLSKVHLGNDGVSVGCSRSESECFSVTIGKKYITIRLNLKQEEKGNDSGISVFRASPNYTKTPTEYGMEYKFYDVSY